MFLRIILLTSIPVLLAYKLQTGKEFDASHYSANGEKGEKGYTGLVQTANGAKGHHDKENHQKQYAEKEGHRKGYGHQDGYYANQHQGNEGSKGYHYADHGKYAKGHSTKGHHNVHKLNEYKKNTDFFDENNDEGFEERHGGYEANKAIRRGGHHQGGHQRKGYDEGKYGQLGFSAKGSHYFDDKGHNNAQGNEAYYENHAGFAQKGGLEGFKNFGFSNFKKQ